MQSSDDIEARIDTLLLDLDVDQKAALTAGADSWRITGVADAGVGQLKVTDGPTGARGDLTTGERAVCFPVGAAIGATWNPELVAEIASTLADEARSKGAQVLLGPTVNLHRHPLAGRNFECYSEDPELTAALAVAFISALQAEGIGASLKHFVANDSEFERHTISSEVDETTLREVYLRPFEAAVAAADPWTIMAAYNRINGTHATENRGLQVDLLKDEWGWPGVIVSDWYATHDTLGAGNGGLDLEMPGPPSSFGPSLAAAVRTGEVPESELDDKARRVLRLYARTGKLDQPDEIPETSVDTPERRALARRAAAESMVLLTNDGVLPLSADDSSTDVSSVAVIGPNASPGRIQGGGSSQVTAHYETSPLEGLRDRLRDRVTYQRGCGIGVFGASLDPGLLADGGFDEVFFATGDFSGAPFRAGRSDEAAMSFWGAAIENLGHGNFSARWTAQFTPDQSGTWTFQLAAAGAARILVDGDVVVADAEPGPKMLIWPSAMIAVDGSIDLEAGRTYDLVVELAAAERGSLPHLRTAVTPPVADAELRRAVDAAAAADVAVVVVGTSSDFETEGEDRTTMALPGDQDELIRRVVAANPDTIVVVNAGAPVAMPWRDQVRAVVWGWFGGQEFGNALADVLLGDVDPGGRLPTTIPERLEDTPAFTNYPGEAGMVHYGERLFIGHRWYDRRAVTPAFPFGHGLSYAEFELGDPTATVHADGSVTVSIVVTNVSDRPGTEVVQAYVAPPVGLDAGRPARQLSGFTKASLDAGQTRTLDVAITARSFARWDPDAGAWSVPAGHHTVWLGESSRDLTEWVDVEPGERMLATPAR